MYKVGKPELEQFYLFIRMKEIKYCHVDKHTKKATSQFVWQPDAGSWGKKKNSSRTYQQI